MNSEKKLILETLPFAKENKARSWLLVISSFMLLAFAQMIVFYDIHCVFRISSSVMSGLLIVRLFVIYHDYLHDAILSRSKLANVIFIVFGYYILTPKSIWKRSHNYHHAHNSKLSKSGFGSFPVYTKSRFDKLKKMEKRKYLFMRHPIVLLFGFYFTFLYGMCISPLFKSFSRNSEAILALVFHLTLQTTVFFLFGWETFIFFGVIPHFVSGAIGTYLFYIQHNFPEVLYSVDQDWTYENAALESSSFLKTSKFMNWITANIGHHHIHHLNSRIPFYNLPRALKEVEGLKKPKSTTLKIRDVYYCLQLKFWDTDENKMVGRDKL